MIWKLISYSETKVPLPPYREGYIIGIVEDENGKRLIAQIDKKYLKKLSIGIKGKIKIIEDISGKIEFFVPDLPLEMEKAIERKVALITGSSKGIGRAIAIELAKKGINLIINSSKSVHEGTELVEEIKKIGSQAIYIKAEVSDSSQVEKMIEEAISKYGRIDILINNAGITIDKKLENMDISQWNKVISVNLTGTFNCTKAVIKHMLKQGRGKIINISSIIGEVGNIGQSNYSASKGGIIAFTKTVAKEYASNGIIVNAVAPGFIKTDMLETIPNNMMQSVLNQIPLGRLGKPEEVAKLVGFLVSEEADYITGQVININGGLLM